MKPPALPPGQMDHGIDAIALLEAEIETLMIRLLDQDADAVTRLEKLLSKIRMMRVVDKSAGMH